MSFLQLQGISKAYADVHALANFHLTLTESQIVALLGPSGCGKTTLLRIIAGLETADSGHITLDGHMISKLPTHRRGFGLMFQDYALFPHMNVSDNIAFGLQSHHLSADATRQQIHEALALVGLEGFEQRDVNELSGGEQQRVALARSLAPRPRLLMLDEPLGSLDRTLREQLMADLHTILKRVGVTALYVTHDQQEAFAIADQIILMQAGRVVQIGSPEEVYQRPANKWAARFLGLTNLLAGHVEAHQSDSIRITSPIGTLHAALNTHTPPPVGAQVTILIHPEGATLAHASSDNESNTLHGIVQARSFRGSDYLLQVRHNTGALLTFRVPATETHVPASGHPATLRLNPLAITLWSQNSD